MTFENLNLIPQLLQAVKGQAYSKPTPVQLKTIPYLLEGKDLFASAQTGTGKTAAFALPLLQLLHTKNPKKGGIKALILAPTRELASQIFESFRVYGKNLKLYYAVVYGGVSQRPQVEAIRRGVDVLVATPGRLLDLINQNIVKLKQVEYLVIDEADRMLDMGFIKDIKRIIPLIPTQRQTIFFSATLTAEIKELAASMLKQPVMIDIAHSIKDGEIKKQLYYVEKGEKTKLLCHIIETEKITTALVFTRTKHGADRLAKELVKAGIDADAIHGNKSQYSREKSLRNFKSNHTKILVATDVASRGIDIKHLPHVINYDMPENSDAFTHRVGRTGRAGAVGMAISFCSPQEKMCARPILRIFPEIKIEKHPFKKVEHGENGHEGKTAVASSHSGSRRGSSGPNRFNEKKRTFRRWGRGGNR